MRQSTTPGALVAALGFFLLGDLALSAEVPQIRFTEIGDRGVAFADTGIRASVEVTAREPFRGSLFVTYHWVMDLSWRKLDLWGDRRRMSLDLRPGTTSLEVELPSSSQVVSRSRVPRSVDLVWVLENARGRRLSGGVQAVKMEPAPAQRILRITSESGEGFRRLPAEAFALPKRYQPYSFVFISASDLGSLNAKQRQALFDAVALGLTLIVTPSSDGSGNDAFGALGPPFDDVLGNERLVWKGDAGEEIRETVLLWGALRRTTLGPAPPPQDLDSPALLPYMLLTAPQQTAGDIGITTPLMDRYWARDGERVRRARHALLLTVTLIGGILGLLFWSSRKHGRPPRWPVAAALVALLLSPAVLYTPLTAYRAGNLDWEFHSTVHDPLGLAACVQTYEIRGGGGGSEPVRLSFEPRERQISLTRSLTELTAETAAGRPVQVTASESEVTWGRVAFLWTREIVPPDPLWEVHVRREGDRLSGTLEAKRAVKDSWLFGSGNVGPPRASHIGTVPAGGTVDVSSLVVSSDNSPWIAKDGTPLRAAWMGWQGHFLNEFTFPWAYWACPRLSAPFIISEEISQQLGPPHFSFQAFLPDGGSGQEFVTVPAVQKGREIHAAIPDAIGFSLDFALESVVKTRFPSFDFAQLRPERIEESKGGFRQAVFRAKREFSDSWMRPLRRDLPRGAAYMVIHLKKEE